MWIGKRTDMRAGVLRNTIFYRFAARKQYDWYMWSESTTSHQPININAISTMTHKERLIINKTNRKTRIIRSINKNGNTICNIDTPESTKDNYALDDPDTTGRRGT